MKKYLKTAMIRLGLGQSHKSFLDYLQRQRFIPSIIGGVLTNPFYLTRKELYANIKSLAPCLKGRILDVGCGTMPYKEFIHGEEYDGLEIDTPKTRTMGFANFFYDGKSFPFPDGTYDGIVCNQVLEHVFEPDIFLSEMNRVLKKGGLLLLTVPFVWDEHDQPHDFGRYSSFGLTHIFKKHSFEITEHRKSTTDMRAIFQLMNGYIYKKTVTKSVYINLCATIALMSPFTIAGILLSKLLPKKADLFLDNVVLARKI